MKPADHLHAQDAVEFLDHVVSSVLCAAFLLPPRPGVDHRAEEVCLAARRVERLHSQAEVQLDCNKLVLTAVTRLLCRRGATAQLGLTSTYTGSATAQAAPD